MIVAPEPGSVDYLALRRRLREPIQEIFKAASLLSEAAEAHLAGNIVRAAEAIRAADIPAIRHWIESLWGSRKLYPEKIHHLRIRKVIDLPAAVQRNARVQVRGPSSDVARKLIAKFGWNCAYCGIPLIDRGARAVLRNAYPNEVRWGATNDQKHTAFMCMDNEFDHVLPHSRGGTNDFENLVTSCAPCNCGKEAWTLDQVGLLDPRDHHVKDDEWDGLTRLVRLDMIS